MVNFGPLAAEICWRVWGTPSNFKGFRVLEALLHGTQVLGVSQTLRRWTEGATCVRQGDHWALAHILVNKFFFRLSIYALVPKTWPDKVVRWCQNGDFLCPVFPSSRVQHISDLHSKFALGPHHVWKYGRHPICDCWDYARKKKKEEERRNRMKI